MQELYKTTSSPTGSFHLRPATMGDLEPVVSLINRCGLAETGRPLTSTRETLDDWKMDRFDLASATRVAETDQGRLVGYIEVWDINPVPVRNWVWARVDPGYEAHGVGTAMMNWAEQRLTETLARVPDDVRVVMQAAAGNGYPASVGLFENLGMSYVRRFWQMMAEFEAAPEEPVWPDGISLTTFAERPDLRAIFLAENEAFRDHWGHVEQPEEEAFAEWKEWMERKSDLDPTLWFLALDGEAIAGLCRCSLERTEFPDAAWVNVLAVRRPWRGRGLGLALLQNAFGELYRRGKSKVGLGVDSANPNGATRLYTKAGMDVINKDDIFEKELRPGRDYGQLD